MLKKFYNLGTADRVLRFVLGVGLIYMVSLHADFINDPVLNTLTGVFGLLNLISSLVRVCPAYLLANFSTLRTGSGKRSDSITEKLEIPDSQARSTTLLRRKLQFSVVLPMIALLVVFGAIVVNLSHQHNLSVLTKKMDTAADVAARSQLVSAEESDLGMANGENAYLATSVIKDSLVDADVFFLHDINGNPIASAFEKGAEKLSIIAAIGKVGFAGTDADDRQRRGMISVDKQQFIWSSTRVGDSDQWFTAVMKTPSHYKLSSYLLSPSFLIIIVAVVWMAIWTSTYIVRKFVDKMNENSTLLQHRSLHDPLTGLPNRQKLRQLIQSRISTLDADRECINLLLIDLIDFRDINDTLGYAFGDQLLVRVGNCLSEIEPASTDVARMGGDVFCLICVESRDSMDPSRLSNAVRGRLQSIQEVNGMPVAVQIRVGMSRYPDDSKQPDELIRFSDIALAKAKSLRIRDSHYQHEQDAHSLRKLTLLTRLSAAIEQDELTLVYQPKVDIHKHTIVGVEVLVRWNDTEYGPVSPVEFVTWAEKSGLIDKLTRWVLQTAEKQCRQWQGQGYFIACAVNISPTNLYDSKLIPLISRLVEEGSFGDGMLELEITENAVMEDPEKALQAMNVIRKMGVKFAIDDFGTGLSSFAYLRRLPVSNLEIDRAFILDTDQSDKDTILLRSMIKLGQGLGCVVTAEGVEDQAALERLKSYGCDYVQGYHVCRPLAADDLLRWIDSCDWRSQARVA